MFKSLKEKVTAQVNKTNPSLFASILSTDSTSLSRESRNRTSSITSRDENLENNRSRVDSASSDISQTSINNINYVPSPRQFIPPTDIDSETDGNENEPDINNKLLIYKNKFTQLKNAYIEVEHENDRIRNILQKQQDVYIKKQTELREQIKLDRQAKEQFEHLYEKEIKSRDSQIQELTQKLTTQKNLIQTEQTEIRNLREKNAKLETLLTQRNEAIEINQHKQVNLIIERDNLSQQLLEKQKLIDSMMKDHHSEDTSTVKENFDSDISVLLHDKGHLQEQLETTRLCVRQLETDLELIKQQQQQAQYELNEELKSERDELKKNYEDLLTKYDEKSSSIEQIKNDKLNSETLNKEFQDQIKSYQETILNNKQQIEQLNNEIEIFKQTLSTQNEQNSKSFDNLKIDYENLTNELHQTKQTRDNIQSLLDQTTQERTIYKDKYEQTQQHEQTDSNSDQIKTRINKLEHDYNESLANCTQLTRILDTQREEHLEEIATFMSQQTKFDSTLNELRKENDHLKSQIDEIINKRQKTMEILKTDFVNIQQEQLSMFEDEFQIAVQNIRNKIIDSSSQINKHQEEINHLEQLLNEQTNKSHQYEKELQDKTSHIIQLEQEFEKFKSQSNLSQKELVNENNLLKEQYQQIIESNTEKNEQLAILQNEFDNKIAHIKNIEEQLEEKQNEIIQLNNTIDELKGNINEHEQFRQSIQTSQINDQQLIEENDKTIDTLEQDLFSRQSSLNQRQDYQLQVEKLKNEYQQIINEKQEEIDNLRQQLISPNAQLNEKPEQEQNEKYFELERKLNNILSEKSHLENELDTIRLQIQTTESTLNDNNIKLKQAEEKIEEFETERNSYRNEIETLKNEIVSLININEENTRRIDDFDIEKFNFEEEIDEKNRQISEYDEKIRDIESNLKQTQENNTKLRKALQKMKESKTNNEPKNPQEIQLEKITEEYEKRFQQQEREYNIKLKRMAKEMNAQIEEKDQNYNRQLNDFIEQAEKTESDRIKNAEQRATDAEQRAIDGDKEIIQIREQLQEEQLKHYRIVRDLQIEVQRLTREKPATLENFSQTIIEYNKHDNDDDDDDDDDDEFTLKSSEIDYLKKIILAYMTGTDPLTMARVICAVLNYNDSEKSLIIENEKLRHTHW